MMYNRRDIDLQLNVLTHEFPQLYKVTGMFMITSEEYRWSLWIKGIQKTGEDEWEDYDDYIDVTLELTKNSWEVGKVE